MRFPWSKSRAPDEPDHGRPGPAPATPLAEAALEAAQSLAQAKDDHAREQAAVQRDRKLIDSLRTIRRENHFADTITAAFRGET